MQADAASPSRPFVRGMRAGLDGLRLAFADTSVRKAYLRVALALFAMTAVIEGGSLWALWANTAPGPETGSLALVGLWLARIIGSLVLFLVGPLIAILTINIVFPFFNEGVFMAGLKAVDPRRAELVAAGPGMPVASAAGNAVLRLLVFLGMSLMFLLVGLIPVVGSVLGAVGQAWLTARTVGWELLDPYFDRLDLRYAEQRRYVTQHRRELLGFGLPLSLLLAVPVVGPLFFGVAQAAAATYVSREVPLHPREQATAQAQAESSAMQPSEASKTITPPTPPGGEDLRT